MDYYFNFISIDPGTTHIGFSIWSISVDDYEILKVDSFTYNVSNSEYDKDIESIYGTRFAKLLVIEEIFKNLLIKYKPISIACESPFYFFKRPGAFAPLVETLYVLKKCVFNYDSSIPFITYDPSSIKNSIGAKGNSDKKIVKNSMISLTSKLPISEESVESLDEHSIDSIAVGYCHYNRYILNIEKN